jgi:glycine cleavage system H protein
MNVPKELLYSKDHEWVKVEGNKAYIGITDYAQSSLGDIVFVELPSEGDEFAAHDTFGVVESVKAASDLFAPVSGTVLEINTALEDNPEVLNADAYANWIIAVELKDAEELKSLLSAEAYADILE